MECGEGGQAGLLRSGEAGGRLEGGWPGGGGGGGLAEFHGIWGVRWPSVGAEGQGAQLWNLGWFDLRQQTSCTCPGPAQGDGEELASQVAGTA